MKKNKDGDHLNMKNMLKLSLKLFPNGIM